MNRRWLAYIFIAFFVMAQSVDAKGPFSGMGNGGPFGSGGGGSMSEYEEDKVKTIMGVVTKSSIDHNPHMKENGLHVYVETSNGEYKVHVAPEWVMKQQNINFLDGEYIVVTGSEFELDGDKNMFAATVLRKTSSLSLEKQKELALETLKSEDLETLAKKYGVKVQEVENIKIRFEPMFNSVYKNALYPDPMRLREEESGDTLWSGRLKPPWAR